MNYIVTELTPSKAQIMILENMITSIESQLVEALKLLNLPADQARPQAAASYVACALKLARAALN